MRLFFICFLSLYLFVGPIHAAQSSVIEAEGSACMGDDKSRKQTEQAAMNDAKKKAVEFVSTQIRSETQIKNFELEKDQLSLYANAEVKIIKELDKKWYKDESYGDCYKIRIKAEIIPNAKPIEIIKSDEDKKRAYELQENCSKNAQLFFDYYVTDPQAKQTDEFVSHYNTKLNRCFVLVKHGITHVKDIYTENLFDAIERKQYGSYAWAMKEDKKYWEVKPLICQTLDKLCNADYVFNEFVKKYMEE